MPLSIHVHPRARSAARPTTAEAYAEDRIRSSLEGYAAHVRSVALRFDEIVNTTGRVDQVCRVHVELSKVFDAPKFVVEGRVPSGRQAADLAADAVKGAVGREVEDAEARLRKRRRKPAKAAGEKKAAPVLAVRRANAGGS